MIDLPYSLVIEATADPDFFGFFSPELEGFSGVGHSVEDCLYKARWGMQEHVDTLAERQLPVPPANLNPTVTIQNEQSTAAMTALAEEAEAAAALCGDSVQRRRQRL
jgi:predicted RNase H-like HicB family nuclease